ncbi:MAG: nucleoside deaminase [Clostridia bacterium]|nr:nucleoside deaminase [Clostridia bacterium]MBR3553924.1 nucleoside deaminase [Clostridia bacterium]
MRTDKQWMELALSQARLAQSDGEVPVGAVIVRGGEVLAVGRNRRETENDAVAHAEIEAIRAACRSIGDWRLTGCTLYVTLEPCVMCFGAIVNARLDAVVFGAYDPAAGCLSCADLTDSSVGPQPCWVGGYMEAPCGALLQSSFRSFRARDLPPNE